MILTTASLTSARLEGRWKLVILFKLFGGKLLRFSDLERAIPSISQKTLIQQLRQMDKDGIVTRLVHHQVPPKVEYGLTEWGQSVEDLANDIGRAIAARCDIPAESSCGKALSKLVRPTRSIRYFTRSRFSISEPNTL
nr:winged helix-turn-helix transcriptional regulator [Agrobacterium sp. rho-13.3]MDX8306774.1 winged helix-turn-helix transcriptional regulator [Agrobacterium sp. rho-13.3]MDX8306895.1 winged helix-turn-helix transcriptional regulator [Agrobacterium sp. rho-13.3]